MIMRRILSISLFCISVQIVRGSKSDNCSVDLDERLKKAPFLLDGSEIVRPSGSRILVFGDGERLTLYCHGSGNDLKDVPGLLDMEYVHLKCTKGKWKNGRRIVDVHRVSCSRKMEPLIREINKPCIEGSKGYLVRLGFAFFRDFRTQIELCHDKKESTTLWTHHVVHGASIEVRDKTSGRPSFRIDVSGEKRFYNFTSSSGLTKQYSKKIQVETIKKLLNTDNLIKVDGRNEEIIQSSRSGTNYLAKGHLSPDAAFIYDVEQDATYYFMNAAPQFQSFNNGNWKALEMAVRAYAHKHQRRVYVYTGTFRTLSYSDNRGTPVDIFLYPDGRVPAPEYYWKVVHDKVKGQAIAFIGLNDPHARQTPKLCTDRCSGVSMAGKSYSDFTSGFMTCCSLDEFRKIVDYLPDLTDENGNEPGLLVDRDQEKKKYADIDGCPVVLDDMEGKYQPLLIRNGHFAYPTSVNTEGKRIIAVEEDETLTLVCHGAMTTYVQTDKETSTRMSSIEVQCLDKTLTFNGRPLNMTDVTCNKKNEPRLFKTEKSSCSPQGADGRKTDLGQISDVKIGWEIRNKFITQIHLCIDEKMYATLWTSYGVMGASIGLRDTDPGRPSFRADITGNKGRFFTFTTSTGLNRIYSKKSQMAEMIKEMGTNEINGADIIETSRSGTHYFAKGHLAPDAAFIFNVLQDATYYFINAAPQFQSFNNGNWKALEMGVRAYAGREEDVVRVHTGTFGYLEYREKAVFLHDGKEIPAPAYYWKVVHNKAKNQATAFIGSNDPHAEKAPKPFCEGQCPSWAGWDMSDIDAGFMYCCRVQDLRKKIPYIPDIRGCSPIYE